MTPCRFVCISSAWFDAASRVYRTFNFGMDTLARLALGLNLTLLYPLRAGCRGFNATGLFRLRLNGCRVRMAILSLRQESVS